jgi:hypothetical protein
VIAHDALDSREVQVVYELTLSLLQRIDSLDSQLREILVSQKQIFDMLSSQQVTKQWYTTSELAEIMGVKQYTVQERWCNKGRIECEKDPDSGKWRIPGHEVRRLKNGGGFVPL